MQNEQPGWRPGPVFLHFPAPSMAACFLLAAGVLSALIHREESGRGQHVQTSLYQGVFAYTTMIWQEHEQADAAFRAMMAKTYPPGVHQVSLYECADGEWIHAATMNGRTPTRSVEEILGVEHRWIRWRSTAIRNCGRSTRPASARPTSDGLGTN